MSACAWPQQRREALGLAPGDTDPYYDGLGDEEDDDAAVRSLSHAHAHLRGKLCSRVQGFTGLQRSHPCPCLHGGLSWRRAW